MLSKVKLEKCSTAMLERLYQNTKLEGIPKKLILEILRKREEKEKSAL